MYSECMYLQPMLVYTFIILSSFSKSFLSLSYSTIIRSDKFLLFVVFEASGQLKSFTKSPGINVREVMMLHQSISNSLALLATYCSSLFWRRIILDNFSFTAINDSISEINTDVVVRVNAVF